MSKDTFSYKGIDGCYFITDTYYEPHNLYLGIITDSEPIAVCTINVPEIELDKDSILIKDWSENSGMIDFLGKMGIIKSTYHVINVNNCAGKICQLTKKGKSLFNID